MLEGLLAVEARREELLGAQTERYGRCLAGELARRLSVTGKANLLQLALPVEHAGLALGW